MVGTRVASALLGIAVLAMSPTLARAQAHVTAADGRSWTEVIDDLVRNVGSEGTVVPLCVRGDDARCMPCGTYALSFDADAAGAFEMGACDPASGTTPLRLAQRALLFDHRHAIALPLAVVVHAQLAASDTAESATPRAAGSGVGCNAHVQPYVRDLEHGTLVMLGSDAYDLRVARAHVSIAPSTDGGFVVSSMDGGTYDLEYDVIERASGSVVLVGHTSLTCRSTADVPATAPGSVSPDLATADALASPRGPGTSGIRIHPRSGDRDVAQGLMIGGFGVATGAALALIGIGIATAIHVSPTCLRTSAAPASTVGVSPYGATPGSTSGAAHCLEYSAPHASTTPAELTWTMVGLLGAGAAVGVLGLIVQALLPSDHDRGPRMLVDLGPNGGTLGVALTF